MADQTNRTMVKGEVGPLTNEVINDMKDRQDLTKMQAVSILLEEATRNERVARAGDAPRDESGDPILQDNE